MKNKGDTNRLIDNIDLFILKEFAKLKENEYTTTWKIKNKIFPKERNNKNHMKIKRRIERLSAYGLFKIEGNPKVYTLDSNKVFFKKTKFPNRIGDSLLVSIEDKWKIFEI